MVRGTHGDQEMEDATLGASQVAQMAAYLEYVQLLKTSFTEFELVHVSREQNARAYLLAKLAS